MTQQGAQESISGRLALNKYDPLSGLGVTVQRGDQTFETTTDKRGNSMYHYPARHLQCVRLYLSLRVFWLIKVTGDQGGEGDRRPTT